VDRRERRDVTATVARVPVIRGRLNSVTTRAARFLTRRASTPRQLAHNVRIADGVRGEQRVDFAGDNEVGRYTTFGDVVRIGYGTTIGEACHVVGPATIGNYCQLAPAVCVYGQDHPTEFLSMSTSPAFFDRHLRDHLVKSPVTIGHGSWLGCNSVVLRGVTVGNGAVVGAGTVVTRDVEPYAVVVGNPARVVRTRFDDETAALVEESRWWELTHDELAPFEPLLTVSLAHEPDRARELLREAIGSCRSG
jgi:acetyltransferase-like isoleucine patch superfamily enzyme